MEPSSLSHFFLKLLVHEPYVTVVCTTIGQLGQWLI
jgi:hypothetical protein